jgi:hypothetical protein
MNKVELWSRLSTAVLSSSFTCVQLGNLMRVVEEYSENRLSILTTERDTI